MAWKEKLRRLDARLSQRTSYRLARDTVKDWTDDDAPRLSAALAYYSLFSIAPLFVIAIAIAGYFFGHEAAREQMLDTAGNLIGEAGREGLATLLASVDEPRAGIAAALASLAVLVFGATNAFAQLQAALNTVWEVRPNPGQGVKGFLRKRFLSLGLVLGVGFLLIVSLVVSAALAALGRFMSGLLPANEYVWLAVNELLAVAVLTLAFATIFKYLPDAKIRWRDVFSGALMTAILFEVGKFLLGAYLGTRGVGSAYGAAGSVLVILIWIYYAGLIFFLGAELTQVWANRRGASIRPEPHAVSSAGEEARKDGETSRRGKGARRPGSH